MQEVVSIHSSQLGCEVSGRVPAATRKARGGILLATSVVALVATITLGEVLRFGVEATRSGSASMPADHGVRLMAVVSRSGWIEAQRLFSH
ncbi:MAG: hypothetical protein OXC08_08130 [Thiotrichales bacterium]|nr:hypothetical protein [Thiotrichales bacterium]